MSSSQSDDNKRKIPALRIVTTALTILAAVGSWWYVQHCYAEHEATHEKVRLKLIQYHQALDRFALDLSQAEAYFRKTVETLRNPKLTRRSLAELKTDEAAVVSKMQDSCLNARNIGDEYIGERRKLGSIADLPAPQRDLEIQFSLCSLLSQKSNYPIEVDTLLSDHAFRQKYIDDIQRLSASPMSPAWEQMATTVQVTEGAMLSSAKDQISGIRGMVRCLKLW